MRKIFLITLLILALALVACGGGEEEAAETDSGSVGNVERGEELFNQTTIGSASAPGCVTCHSLEPDVVLVGPSHADIGSRAEERAENLGVTPEEYLRESIVNPDAVITEGYTAGVMYQNYGEELQARDINDLVAFMMTLE